MGEIDTSTAAIEALMDGVTEGPWVVLRGRDSVCVVASGKHLIGEDFSSLWTFENPKDWDFVAASRQIIPALAAERDALRAEMEQLRHQINEASDPEFIWGAMDNVHDCDTTIDDYADAVSRAIRAALEKANDQA